MLILSEIVDLLILRVVIYYVFREKFDRLLYNRIINQLK